MSRVVTQGPRSLRRIFAAPVAIALLSLTGLLLALIGDGAPDVLAWLCLAVPVAAFAWALRARRA